MHVEKASVCVTTPETKIISHWNPHKTELKHDSKKNTSLLIGTSKNYFSNQRVVQLHFSITLMLI